MQQRYNRDSDLYDYFRKNFGPPNSTSFKNAQNNFADSLAAYSLACFIL